VIQEARLSFGAVNPVVIRERSLEALLLGQKLPLRERDLKPVLARLEEILHPADYPHTTREYQVETVLRMAQWFLQELHWQVG
jgi:CO/xanthine dehydrogenase FAD-binding subunit